jgi:hypothetical protein
MEAEERARPGTGEAEPPPPQVPIPPDVEPRPEDGSDRSRTDAVSSNERCAHHAGRPAVARCAACGEAVCITCAVPVRGRVLGPGCVAAELGDPALVAPPEREVDRSWVAVAGALLAVAGTVAPWTRTGAGDRLFGAWVMDVRWSTIAAVAAVALLGFAWRSRAGDDVATSLVAPSAMVVLVGAALAIMWPPTFQSASWGPWLTAAGALLAGAGSVLAIRSGSGRTQGV